MLIMSHGFVNVGFFQMWAVVDFDWSCLLSKLLLFTSAKIKFLDESFYNNNHTYTGESY